MQAEGLLHQRRRNALLAPHRRHIADTTQQAIGDARGAAAAAGHLPGGAWLQRQLQQAGGALDDRLQVVEAIELQPLHQPEAITQR